MALVILLRKMSLRWIHSMAVHMVPVVEDTGRDKIDSVHSLESIYGWAVVETAAGSAG